MAIPIHPAPARVARFAAATHGARNDLKLGLLVMVINFILFSALGLFVASIGRGLDAFWQTDDGSVRRGLIEIYTFAWIFGTALVIYIFGGYAVDVAAGAYVASPRASAWKVPLKFAVGILTVEGLVGLFYTFFAVDLAYSITGAGLLALYIWLLSTVLSEKANIDWDKWASRPMKGVMLICALFIIVLTIMGAAGLSISKTFDGVKDGRRYAQTKGRAPQVAGSGTAAAALTATGSYPAIDQEVDYSAQTEIFHSNIILEAGESLTCSASNDFVTWDPDLGTRGSVNAAGADHDGSSIYPNTFADPGGFLNPDYPAGYLFAIVGDETNAEVIPVGLQGKFTAARRSEVAFAINDRAGYYNDNNGSVKIHCTN